MSKKNQYDNEPVFEQPTSGYYFPPMFRCPPEDERNIEDMDMQPPTPGPMPDMAPEGAAPFMMPGMLGTDTGPMDGPIAEEPYPIEPPLTNIAYLQAYLRTQIGKRVRIEFLIGTNTLTDRSGTLTDVGISYVILRDPSGARVVCDLYSIKFVNIFD
ncbi:hypothetical protein [Fonticella tunisiensis]|uniref:Uncharacterized protein n=1 Tax=Fonticella tunisiensis TaxID=1096341 RepID=A0A4V3ETB5_9CLOT|nr:hypothetical protein [Fonticella tunisiensis]TDT60947.1 hypothetical protein EDD71_11065 [Fonticella tunisiensis]